MQETQVRSLVWENPLEKRMAYPLQYSYLANSMDRRAWRGYSPWSCKESDTTERLTLDHVAGTMLSA